MRGATRGSVGPERREVCNKQGGEKEKKNISYGLPARKFMNQAFMVMAIARGLDGAIINPLDSKMMANIIAAEALAGRDNFCMNYLKAFRAGKFEF